MAFGAALVTVSAWKLAGHAMWRDELQSWDLASTSSSVGQLLSRVRYERHPPLWYLLLWVVSRVTSDPVALQAVQLVLTAALITLVLRWAPFTRWVRWSLLLGYFPFFEYSTFARPYLAELLLALVGAHLVRRHRLGWGLAATLGSLILLDDAFGTALALALLAGAIAVDRRARRRAGAALAVAGAVIAAVLISRPPAGYDGPLATFAPGGIPAALIAPLHGLLPIPDVQQHFWNTWLIDGFGTASTAVLGCLLLLVVGRLVRGRRGALAVWSVGACASLCVLTVTEETGARFAGTFFILAVVTCWIGAGDGPGEGRTVHHLILAVALAAIPGSVVGTAEVVVHPFSEAASAARVVRHLPGAVVAIPDYAATPVAGLAGRSLYFPIPARWGTFAVWDERSEGGGESASVAAEEHAGLDAARGAATHGPAWLLTDEPLPPTPRVRLEKAFTGAIVGDEDYWLYAVGPIGAVAAPAPHAAGSTHA